jgi:LysM repeat protein
MHFGVHFENSEIVELKLKSAIVRQLFVACGKILAAGGQLIEPRLQFRLFRRWLHANFALISAAALLAISLNSAAEAAKLVAGTLNCEVKSGVGFIVGSTKEASCIFYKSNGTTEAYHGDIKKFGVDLGFTTGGVMAWTVLASTSDLPTAELSGTYGGVDADASLGFGVGAKVLVGGSNRTVSLQPLSVQGQAGINVAVGLVELDLRPQFGTKELWTVAVEAAPARPRYFKSKPHYGCGSYFVMRHGDTLSRVAQLCGNTVEALLDANPAISNTRKIAVGTHIVIPKYKGGPRKCHDKAILQPGEFLDELADRCGVSLNALVAANPVLQDPQAIRDGLVLTLPEG